MTRITQHDGAGRPLTLIDPNNVQTQLSYDARGRLVSSATAGALSLFGYDQAGNLTRLTRPDGTYLDYTYDAANRLTDIVDGLGNRIHYTLDAAGNRTSQTDARGIATTYAYDALNRLIYIGYPGGTLDVRLTYDEGINGIGRLTGMQDAEGSSSYEYDARGNLIIHTRVAGPLTTVIACAYDAADRLAEVTYPSRRKVNCAFDGLTGCPG